MPKQTFDYEKLKSKLKFYLKNNQNVLLEGRAGTGKTTIISQVFDEEFGEGNWLYLSGSTMDPFIDFVGVPREQKDENGNNYLEFVLPRHFVLKKIKAIFIDEYNRAHKKVRNGCMELIQFKSINGKKFPALKTVWVGINPFSDDEIDQSYDVEQLDPAQLDRFQVQIKLPYQADLAYFSNKFGPEIGKAAIEWWNGLSKSTQLAVSPRRLDYAIEMYNMGGDVFDVLPLESNPSKLITSISIGNVEDKLKEIFKKSDFKQAQDFLSVENTYQSSMPFIVKNKEFLRFFLPVISEERFISLFFKHEEVKSYALRNPLYFKEALIQIKNADSCDNYTKNILNKSLKNIENMELIN
jgi:DNA polymerase III delta prime subunit